MNLLKHVWYIHIFQSPDFDGYEEKHYHPKCFFGKNSAEYESEFKDFAKLRYDDQNLIRDHLGKFR